MESRLEAAAGAHVDKDLEPELEIVKERLAALEAAPDPNELDVLRASLEELRARPVTVEGLAELRDAVERVEARPDPAAEIAQLTTDIAALTSRFDAISTVDDLAGRLDAVAEQAEVAQTGIDGLSRRVDELGRLETRLDGVAAGLPGAEAIEELRRELTEISAQAGSDDRGDQASENAALVARLDEIESRLGDAAVSALPDPTPLIDELSARIDEIAEAIPSLDADALQARVDAVEALATRGPDVGAVEELRARVEELAVLAGREPDLAPVDELRARVDELAAVAVQEPDLSAVDELRARVEELAVLAGREPDLAPVDELRARVDELAAVAVQEPDLSAVDELRARVEELAVLAGREPDLTPVDELRARVDELAVLAAREPDLSAVDELRAKMDEVAAVAVQEPDLRAVHELRARVDELALLAAREPDSAPLDELRARIDELATRPHDTAPVDALRARLDELAAVVELATASRQKIHARVDWLAGELATTIAAQEPDTVALGELRSRLDALAAAVERGPDTAALDEIRGRVEKLGARAGNDELIGALETRVTQLEEQLVAATLAAETPAAELREEMRRVAESTVVERESLAQSLFARVEEITSTVPREDELVELRTRFDELAARPTQDHALLERVEQLGARIDGLGSFEGAITGLRESIEGLEAVRVGDALATGARLAALETAVESLGALEDRVREGVARDLDDRARAFAARLASAESRLDTFAALEERIAGLAVDLERRPDTDTLEEVVAAIRAEVDELAARSTVADPSEPLQELSGRIDSLEQDGHDRARGLSDEMSRRTGELATDLGRRIQALVERTEGFVSRDEAAEQTALVHDGLAALRLAAEDRDAAVDASLAEADHARIAAHEELGQTIAALRADLDDRARLADLRLAEEIAGVRSELAEQGNASDSRLRDAADGVRADLEAKAKDLHERLEAQSNETSALRGHLEELQAAADDRTAWETRFEGMLELRVDELTRRLADEVAGARAEAAEATAAVRGEALSLGERIDEMAALRHSDVQAARAASEELVARVDAFGTLRADDADAARAAAADLSTRLESLSASLQKEAADARTTAEAVLRQIGGLHELRAGDLAASEFAGAELAARLDDHALRTAEAAREVELALTEEIGGIAARLEERDVEGIEAREELRGELERVASSVGWRLERIEESLAADDIVQLRTAVADLRQRLDGQLAMSEEQVRATERALRKGLASLGEKLAGTEATYADAGNALRRSIERLGAAVVEADARMADQIPALPVEGCVAFAPTAAGYRLVEIAGIPPEIGSTIELGEIDGPLVVTRYGRSPLPLDSRPCAYLDRA